MAVDPGFLSIAFENTSISGTSIQPSGLKYGTQYYWRVKIPGYGWSVVQNFITTFLSVTAKVFLQGPYNSGSGLMNTSLETRPICPTIILIT